MKNLLLALSLTLVIVSCKKEHKTIDYENEDLIGTTSIYPEKVTKIFDAHGGVDAWNKFESLQFEIEKPEQNDDYVVNLKNRKSLISSAYHNLGFDGENVWLESLDTVSYRSNPKFYYNLMFYFYAMPFVLGDNGINYGIAEPLEFEDKIYPGILISYENGIGESPEDEYILYYDPDTFIMQWLGYTVTYFSKEKGKDFHFIKYNDWQIVEGIKIPKTLHWYKYENNKPTTFRNAVNFNNVKLSEAAPDDALFKVVDSTMIVK